MNVTSERQVYVGLAGAAGAAPTAAGVLKLAQDGVLENGQFAYGRRYLQSPAAEALNPDFLPLQAAPFVLPQRRVRDGGALPLTFRDALPDSWGRKVLEAQHGKVLPDLDVLMLTNADRVGAMVFAEALPLQASPSDARLIELDALAEAVRRLEFDMDVSPAMKRLLHRGGTLGGARPKATFVHDAQRWIAKFPSQGDDYNVEVVEAATLALARQCGIRTADAFLRPVRGGHALLLRRFDREGPVGQEVPRHYLSASALLDVAYESSDGSYVAFAQTLRRISSHPQHDLPELYRRMVFNLVVDNSDDHVKNHGVLLAGSGRYRLAPAFDVVTQMTNIGYQQLAILPGRFDASLDLAREAAAHFGLSGAAADAIIESITALVAREGERTLRENGAGHVLAQRVTACLKKQAASIT